MRRCRQEADPTFVGERDALFQEDARSGQMLGDRIASYASHVVLATSSTAPMLWTRSARITPITPNTTMPTAMPMPVQGATTRERVTVIPRAITPATSSRTAAVAVAVSGAPYMSL